MRGRTVALLLLFAVVILLVATSRTGRDARAEPRVPARGDEAIAEVPARTDPALRELALWRAELRGRPGDLVLAARVARRAIELARARSDPRFLGQAEAALAPWWSADAPPATVRLFRATIRQSTHDFGAALVDLDALVRDDPTHAQAWLTRAVVLTVRGEFVEARRSCDALSGYTNEVTIATCHAGIDGMTGASRKSLDRIEAALETALDPTERAWASSTAGDLASRLGDFAAAERHYLAALAVDASDAYVLGALCDRWLDQRRYPEVVTRLGQMLHADGLLLRLVLAERALGSPAAGAHAALLRDRHAASKLRGDVVHRREEARFVLFVEGRAADALALARANFEVQREVDDLRILFESALAAGDRGAARPALDFVRTHGVEDVAVRKLAAELGSTAGGAP